jgi:two-component system phosphate regulon sensor histidine kinase PhoR
MRIRLDAKWLASFLLIGVLVVGIAGMWITREFESRLIDGVREELTSEALVIALMPEDAIGRNAVALAERSRSRLTLIDAEGRVLADSDRGEAGMDNHLNRSEVQEARLKGRGFAIRYSRTIETDFLYVAILLGEVGQPRGYIRLSRSIADIARSGDPLRRTLFQALVGIVSLSLLAALILSLRLLSPIRRLVAFTEKVRRGDFSGAVRIDSRDEIGDLAGHINTMVSELHEKIRLADQEKVWLSWMPRTGSKRSIAGWRS